MTGQVRSTVWPLQAHTRAKHRLLRGYLDAWFPILGSRPGRIVFIDAFAGPGRYKSGEPGSPILALNTLLTHQSFERLRCEFVFWFLESDEHRFESLCHAIEEFTAARGGLPPNIKVHPLHSTFAAAATDLVARLREQKTSLAPTLAFIDPFGFSGVPLQLLSDLLSFPHCEVLFNFMFESVNRFATSGAVDQHFRDLFGCDDYLRAPESGQQRQEFLRDLYARQLCNGAGFTFVRSFEMVNKRGRTGNYLFFGTRHELGLKVMKEAMWKVDPVHGKRFDATEEGLLSLFGDRPELAPLQAGIISRFAGQRVPIGQLEHFVLLETDYLPQSHLRRGILAPMEADGLIADVQGRKRHNTYPPGSIIQFAPRQGNT
jgi:three-Cys-motif partner protein